MINKLTGLFGKLRGYTTLLLNGGAIEVISFLSDWINSAYATDISAKEQLAVLAVLNMFWRIFHTKTPAFKKD